MSGVALTLSFAPFNFFPLAIISLTMLVWSWQNVSPKRAFWQGWLFGLGLFTSGVYWIFISVHTYGNTSAFLATLITFALIAVLALYPAFTGVLLNRFFPKNNASKLVLAFPALWVLLEWVRCWFLSGFPWLLVGYSQIGSPLKGYAPVLSVYGVSLVVAMSSGLIVFAINQYRSGFYQKIVATLLALSLIWSIGFVLTKIAWTTTTDQPIRISLVQGNVPQELKWSPEQVRPTLVKYYDLTQPHWDSQIIIWPESAIPLPMHFATEFLKQMSEEAKTHHATLITGIPIKASEGDGYYNGIIALGNGKGVYTKQRLVPFGEYIPFKQWLGKVMDLLQVPMSDFMSGQSHDLIIANGKRIAAFVCYEIAYPELVLSNDGHIDLILTISNDAWFGQSIAQAQHAQMAQMRALEMGRPSLFVGNDGITTFINSKGIIQSVAPQHETYVLTDEIYTTYGKTPWQSVGMYPMYLIWLLFCFISYKRRHLAC